MRPVRIANVGMLLVLVCASHLSATPLLSATLPSASIGGDDIESAFEIPSLPFDDSGNTCGLTNDYDQACPSVPNSTSPDVVYSYSPALSEVLDIALCGSSFDTRLYVYANSDGNLVDCSQEGCGEPGALYRARLDCIRVDPGNTYFIVVDGYFACGDYVLSVSTSQICAPCGPEPCPPGAVAEGEPRCFDGYVDIYNAGCIANPETYTIIPCQGSYTICGESGTYVTNGPKRESDWYQMDVPVACQITVTLCPSFDAYMVPREVIDPGEPGCGVIDLCVPLAVPRDFSGTCSYFAPAGRTWVVVNTQEWSGVPCGSPYVLEVHCCTANAARATSWGRLKSLYR